MVEEKNELLRIEGLKVEYRTEEATFYAVNNISLELGVGETLGLVGETGAGKTTTALSIMKLLPQKIGFAQGKIYFNGEDISEASELQMRGIRGSYISMIFQDPMTSLNPVMTVGDQIAEVLKTHGVENVSERVDEMLRMVGIQPSRKNEYPNQFSGGMKQRVVIAMALACEPKLLIADEPTTALDVTIQAQVLAMMNELKEKIRTSMIMITHDLGIVAAICDKVAIMYSGEIVETGSLEDIYSEGKHHPYTVGLFGSIPDMTKKTDRLKPIDGLMPDASDLPSGCKFHDRCPHAQDICSLQEPGVYQNGTHCVKCHLYTGILKEAADPSEWEGV